MPTRFRTFAILLPVAVALGGCAVTDRFTKLPSTGTFTNQPTREGAIWEAENLRDIYRRDIEATRELQLWFDVPLVGLATGTLASVIYKGSRDLSIGLGLAAGTVAAARTYTNPSDRIAAVNRGMKAATCVHSAMSGMPLLAPNTAQVANGITNANQKLLQSLPQNADAESARLFGAAQNRLTEALAKAQSAKTLADMATKLLDRAPGTATAALAAIVSQTDSLIVGSTQDLNAAIAQIEKGAISARDLIGRRSEIIGSNPQPSGSQIQNLQGDGSKRARDLAKEMSDLAVDFESIAENLTAESKDIETKNIALVRCGVI